MPFTVTHARGSAKDAEYREYLRLLSRVLLKQGVNLADVPRLEENGGGGHWLYVWPSQQAAEEFATQLKEQTRSSEWVVREVQTPISRGPLRPLEMQAGRSRAGWTFALAPWARKSIQTQFPGSCQSNSVFVASDNGPAGGLERLAGPLLSVLTGLDAQRVRAFDTYIVTDPVNGITLLPPQPIQP